MKVSLIGILLLLCAIFNIGWSNYMRTCLYKSKMTFPTDYGEMEVKEMDPHLCTHIMQSGMSIKPNQDYAIASRYDMTYLQNLYLPLRVNNTKLKIIASVGGDRAVIQLRDDTERKATIKKVTKFLRQYDWDGLDLGNDVLSGPNDYDYKMYSKTGFTRLIKEFDEEFKREAAETRRPKLLLSATVLAKKKYIDYNYEIKEIGKYLDFVTVQAYDFYEIGETLTGHHAAVEDDGVSAPSRAEHTVSFAVDYWIKGGMPPYKINLGLATYGHTFELRNPSQNGFGAPTTGKGYRDGPYFKKRGLISYTAICKLISQSNFRVKTYRYDNKAKASYGYGRDMWVAFDDADSLSYKIRSQVKAKGLAGVTINGFDMDDPRNYCKTGRFPLITAVRDELGEYDESRGRKC